MKVFSFLRSPNSGRKKIQDNNNNGSLLQPFRQIDQGGTGKGAKNRFLRSSARSGRPRFEDNGSSLSSLYISEDGTLEKPSTTGQFHPDLGAEIKPFDFADVDWGEIEASSGNYDQDKSIEPNVTSVTEPVGDSAETDEIRSIDWGSFEEEFAAIDKQLMTEKQLRSSSQRTSDHSLQYFTDRHADGYKEYPVEPCFSGNGSRGTVDTESSTTRFSLTERKIYKPSETATYTSEKSSGSGTRSAIAVVGIACIPRNEFITIDKTYVAQKISADAKASRSLPSSMMEDHHKYLDSEQPSNSKYLVSHPVAVVRQHPHSANERSRPVSDDTSSSDDLSDLNRIPPKQRWRFRTDLLIIILMAVMLLAIAIAVVSALAVSEKNQTVSAAVGQQTAEMIPSGAPSTSPSTTPSITCASPAIAIGPFLVALTTISGFSDFGNEISEVIDVTKTWIDVVIQNEFPSCYANSATVGSPVGVIENKDGTFTGIAQYSTCVVLTGESSCPDMVRLWELIRDSFSFRVRKTRKLDALSMTYFEYLNANLSGNNPFRNSLAINVTTGPSTPSDLQFSSGQPAQTPSASAAGPTTQPEQSQQSTSPSESLNGQASLPPVSNRPSFSPSKLLSQAPTQKNSENPSYVPTQINSDNPSYVPTQINSDNPSYVPTQINSDNPSYAPTESAVSPRTVSPSERASSVPTANPSSNVPSVATPFPTFDINPSLAPSGYNPLCEYSSECNALMLEGRCCPTLYGVFLDCCNPDFIPVSSHLPTKAPVSSSQPSLAPLKFPYFNFEQGNEPTAFSSVYPTERPLHTDIPSIPPSLHTNGSDSPVYASQTVEPKFSPTQVPSANPTATPFASSSSSAPTRKTSLTFSPTRGPSARPTAQPTESPTMHPTASPTLSAVVPTQALSQSRVKAMILEAAPASTAEALSDPDSAQSLALNHLLNVTNCIECPDLQIIQQFALLSFSFGSLLAGGRRLMRSSSPGQDSSQRLLSATSWLTEGPGECSWVGIFCNPLGQVVAINVAQRNMPGKLVPEWAMLKDSLQLIDATKNDLTGEIPSEYGDLHLLRWLRLSRNLLSGNIPDSFEGLQSLMQLDVFQNKLGGDFPNEVLSKMSSLVTLRIYFNKFTGLIDDSICNKLGLSVFEADCYLQGRCVFPCWSM
ncbi:hypothetical protein ACA910_022148 [Epithemia clementina (nom. ined.)]